MAGAAAVPSEEELLLQIQCLVSDSLRVVSYKWLSRNFSVSSNAAKRLLQIFAKQNENLDLEIVYAISGWSKKEPQSYAIQLVTKSKLEEARAALKEPSSIQVYSVQRCLPKDPAQLWSADFVQAEQLFNESADINNCLRDNRFSAVTCQLVQRLSTRQNSCVAAQPQPPVADGLAIIPPSSTISVPKAPVPKAPVPSLPPKNSETTLKDTSGGKKTTPPSTSSKQNESKNSSGSGTVGKRKAPAVSGGSGGGSGGGGSLASMWGKAPAKPKRIVPPMAAAATVAANPPWGPVSAGDAEARIQAMEAEADSEDDMTNEFTSLRRGQVNNGGGRRRRMIIDDDDNGDAGDTGDAGDGDAGDEDDGSETIIRLCTPPASPQQKEPALAVTRETVSANEGTSSVSEKLPNPTKEISKAEGKPSNLQPNLDSKTKTGEENTAEVKAHPVVPASDLARSGSKRKKVLKTKMDERGREVTEVIWETEGEEKENIEKDAAPEAKQSASSSKQTDSKPPTGKPQAVQKPSMVPSKSAASKANTKTSAKSANKPGKGQGNIMAFFKKT